MKGLNSNCTRNVQIVSISYIKKQERLKKRTKEAVRWHHDQNDKPFTPESLCWCRQEKVPHAAIVRTVGKVYDSYIHAEEAVSPWLYF